MPKALKRKQTTETVEKLYNGKLRIERRNGSANLHARTFLQGKNVVRSTGETTIGAASKIATDWYLKQLDRIRKGEQLHGRLFTDVAERFLEHVEEHQKGELSEGQREQYKIKWNLLRKHFTGVKITDVDARFLLALRNKRSQARTQRKTLVKPATIRKDLTFVRLVLRYGKEWEKCIETLPEFPSFRGSFEVVAAPRPFLDAEQYKRLQQLAKERAEEDVNPRTKRQRQELYWFILICVGGALRVGEAQSLRWCDCELVSVKGRDGTREEAVKMLVLGKHSKGGQREVAWGVLGAVYAFKAMRAARPEAKPEEPLFLEKHRDGMIELLTKADLRTDPKTKRTRDAKSLRPTGISMRLDRQDISYREAARWARTSVAMIEKFYDQNHPERNVERIVGFRKQEPKKQATPRGTRAKTKSSR